MVTLLNEVNYRCHYALNNLEAQALENKLNKKNNRIKIKFGSKTHQLDLN